MEFKEHFEDIDLQRYWVVLKRRWFPASGVFGVTVLLAALVTALQEPMYEARAEILFQTDLSSSLTGLESQAQRGDLEAVGPKSEPLTTQAEIITSFPVAQATIEALDIRNTSGDLVQPWFITGNLSVRPVPGSDVLQISYQSPDPVLAAAVVNQVIEVYQEKNVLMNRAEAAAAREFIVEQLPTTEKTVVDAESALREFKEANNILVLQEEASAAVSSLTTLERQITDVQAQLADISAQTASLRNRVGMESGEAVAMGALSQSPGVQETLALLQETQDNLALERTRYREGHPAVAALARQEAALTSQLQDRIDETLGRQQAVSAGNLQLGDLQQGLISDFVQAEIQRIGLNRRLNELITAQAQLQGRSNRLPALEQTQRELERRLSAAQTTYETLLTRLQEIQVAENQTVGNTQVISEAIVPGSPVAPSKQLNMAAGTLAGLLLAIATAFLLDLFDQSIKTVKEAKRLLGYPVLGIIPAFESIPEKDHSRLEGNARNIRIVVRDMPQSPISSAYQMLQANLNFLSADRKLNSIVITSAVSGEGKSEVAANLATAASQAGKRVLLVDADLRHPTQHHFWDLINGVGLSNLIVGQTSFNQAIQSVLPKLHVLTAGVIPPNTIALLSSQRMHGLIRAFTQHYDLVILDCPALAGAADAATLGKMVDGLLVVVRPGTIDTVQAKNAKEFLTRSNQPVLGLVANGVVIQDEPDSYFYFQEEAQLLANDSEPEVEAVPQPQPQS